MEKRISNPLWYNGFAEKHIILPERKRFSCEKLYQLCVQSATIPQNFTYMVKLLTDTKSINVKSVSINSPQKNYSLGRDVPQNRTRENIHLDKHYKRCYTL